MGLLDLFKGQPKDPVAQAQADDEKGQRRYDRLEQQYARLEQKWAKQGIQKTARILGLKDLEIDSDGRSATAVKFVDGKLLPIRLITPEIRVDFRDRRKVIVAAQHQGALLGRVEYRASSNMFSPQTERFSDAHHRYVNRDEWLAQAEQSLREGPRLRPNQVFEELAATAPNLSALDETVATTASPSPVPVPEL